jgi:hypothetical protein
LLVPGEIALGHTGHRSLGGRCFAQGSSVGDNPGDAQFRL